MCGRGKDIEFCKKMKLTLEALQDPKYQESKTNFQEKFQRAFETNNNNSDELRRRQRKIKNRNKTKKVANKMQVEVFDMLGTTSNAVRAVRKWFQQKEHIKFASVTGKLTLLYLRNQKLDPNTDKIITRPNATIRSNDRLAVLYVLNDLFQRIHKDKNTDNNGNKNRQRRDSTGDESSNTTTISNQLNNISRKKKKSFIETEQDLMLDNGDNYSKQLSLFDYREKWSNIMPNLVGECCKNLYGQDLENCKLVLNVWKTKKILNGNMLQHIIDKYISKITSSKRRTEDHHDDNNNNYISSGSNVGIKNNNAVITPNHNKDMEKYQYVSTSSFNAPSSNNNTKGFSSSGGKKSNKGHTKKKTMILQKNNGGGGSFFSRKKATNANNNVTSSHSRKHTRSNNKKKNNNNKNKKRKLNSQQHRNNRNNNNSNSRNKSRSKKSTS